MNPRRFLVVLTALTLVVGVSRGFAQGAASKAAPSASIPTVSLTNVARHGFYYAGGQYVGQPGPDKESTRGGAMYVEVMVPKQIRSRYPTVFLPGAGQTGADWREARGGL